MPPLQQAVKSAGIGKYSVTSESESELADDVELASVDVTAKERDAVKVRVVGLGGLSGPVCILSTFCEGALNCFSVPSQ